MAVAARNRQRLMNQVRTIVEEMVFHAVGVWVAARVVDGVRLDGGAGRQLLAILVVIAVSQAWGRALQRLTAPVRKRRGQVANWVLVPAIFLFLPFSLWTAVLICRQLDLPLDVSGFWPFILATAVIFMVALFLSRAAEAVTEEGRHDGAAGGALSAVTSLGVLVVIAGALPAVQLTDGPAWRQLLALAVLAVLFKIPDPGLTLTNRSSVTNSVTSGSMGSYRTVSETWVTNQPVRPWRHLPMLAVYAVAVNGLMLWLISWFSTGLSVTLGVAGFGTFLRASLLGTGVMWLVSFLALLVGPLPAPLRLSRFGVRRANTTTGETGHRLHSSPARLPPFGLPGAGPFP